MVAAGTQRAIPDPEDRPGRPPDGLLDHHAELVAASAISDTVARARGYRSVTEKSELQRLGFSERQARVPALLLPVWNVAGKVALYQARPDEPRVENGKVVKYETVAGSRMTIDVPPSIRHQLGDPSIPLWITEGIRKADAAVSAGLCCIALLGVWNWRGTNEFGGKVALPDWESIALNDRGVHIAFDSDVMTKAPVRQALERFKAFLESRHAKVRLIYLPAGPDGAKVGLDDYFAAGHSVDDLLALAADTFHSAHTPTSSRAERNLPFRTARAVAQETPERVVWFVPGYIAAGAVTELVGKIKASGKTTWVTHAVRAIVTGTRFMGLATTRTGVVYLTEQSPTSFRVALARAGLLERHDVVVLFWRDTGGVAWTDVVAAAVEECRRRGCGVLVVDTLPRFAGLRGDAENNAGDADGAMAPLQMAAADGLAVVVVRHERKAGGEVGDSGRGSSAFGGAVDIVLVLKRREGATRPTVRILHALSRFDETPGELVVELGEQGYVALGDEGAVALSDARSRLLSDLPHSPEDALSMTELIERFKDVSATTIERARDMLVTQGDVLRVGKGVKGDPFRYWAPVPDEDKEFHSAPLPQEFGQNEIPVELDYPRSAWDPDAGSDGPRGDLGLVSPVRAPDPGGAQ